MDIISVIGWASFVVQVYLTIVAWRVGWKWKALLPYVLGTFLGGLVMLPFILLKVIPYARIMAASNNDPVLTQQLGEDLGRQMTVDPVIMTISYLTSFSIIAVLYFMVKSKRSKLESASH